MVRKIIQIDEEKCIGCGICAEACHEGAIGMVDGKAKLLRDDYCDGLGDCLPTCPTGAITFVEREALAYDEAAVKQNMAQKQAGKQGRTQEEKQEAEREPLACGCPGTQSRAIHREQQPEDAGVRQTCQQGTVQAASQLSQWPVQIKLAPVKAPYFDGANLLVAADCTAYAYGDFHNRFIRNHITLVGCPKLDAVDYSEKLTEIIRSNDIKSVTVVRMEVPCCGGIEHAVKMALKDSGKFIPWQIVTISTDGQILD